MQPPLLELDHDGFRARFGAPVLLPRAIGATAVGLIAGACLLALLGTGGGPVMSLFALAALIALFAGELARPWVLEGRAGQLRLGRVRGRRALLDSAELVVEVQVVRTPAAGVDGALRRLVLTTPDRTWRLPATAWSEDELRAFATLLEGVEPGKALPAPPRALQAMVRSIAES